MNRISTLHANHSDLVHMNGRIYDPKLGRMLQADPFVQSPKDSQSLNRYTYVNNNPLSYTDPSGYFSFKRFFNKWVRPLAAIAISIWLPQLGVLWQTLQIGSSIAIGGITGFIAGYVGSGNLNGALAGAFAGTAFGAQHKWNAVSRAAKFGKSLAHGAVGGVQNLIQDAKFGHGFLSAGVTQSLSGVIGRIPDQPVRVMAAAVVGGTASQLTGGKFANGAVTGAFSRALNDDLKERIADQDIRTLSKAQARALSKAAQGYLREIRHLTPDEMLIRFPELQTFVSDFGKVDAADYGREILRGHLVPIASLSTAKFLSEHIMDNFDSALADVLIGEPIGHFFKAAGYAWDVYSFSSTNSFLFSETNVIIACNLDAGCRYAVD